MTPSPTYHIAASSQVMNDSVNVSERYRQPSKFEGIAVEKPQKTPLNYESAVQFAEKLNVPIVDSAR